MRLLFVRHGQTVGNILRQLQDDHDPLTELGRRQAYEVAAHLATLETAEALYCSPLPRALDTATTIGAAATNFSAAMTAIMEIAMRVIMPFFRTPSASAPSAGCCALSPTVVGTRATAIG